MICTHKLIFLLLDHSPQRSLSHSVPSPLLPFPLPLAPVFRDVRTPSPFTEPSLADDPCAKKNALPDHIYMDCMGFGMGCSCLQVTFQGCDVEEACHLYDQLSIVCPIMVREDWWLSSRAISI